MQNFYGKWRYFEHVFFSFASHRIGEYLHIKYQYIFVRVYSPTNWRHAHVTTLGDTKLLSDMSGQFTSSMFSAVQTFMYPDMDLTYCHASDQNVTFQEALNSLGAQKIVWQSHYYLFLLISQWLGCHHDSSSHNCKQMMESVHFIFIDSTILDSMVPYGMQ